jgi:hypothetical protein
MATQIRLTRTKGDVKDVMVEYVSILDSGVLEFEVQNSNRVTYLAVGSWLSMEEPKAP